VPALHYGANNFDHSIYEDVLAPDAFGAQLFGAGHAGRVPFGEEWERIDVGDRSVLLVHRDPAAWFAEPLPPITYGQSMLSDPPYPTPPVILRGRRDFAEILIHISIVRASQLDPLAQPPEGDAGG